MATRLTIAAAQCPADLDGAARLVWLDEALAGHRGDALDLVVLPELFQCGYDIGDLVSARAETADGPFAAAIAALAERHRVAIVYGFAERAGAALYNAAQCIDATGTTIGRHRKLVLPPGYEGDHFTPGDGCDLFRLGGITLAILVCYDVEFPEAVRHVALAGAEAVLVPTALGAEWEVVADRLVPARAFENGVYLCYANYCGRENGTAYLGRSCVIGPDGRDLARAGSTAGLAVARLDPAAVRAAQDRLPYHADRQNLPWIGASG